MNKHLTFILFFLLIFCLFPIQGHCQLTGYVLDNYKQPVSNAKIVFTDELDPTLIFTTFSDLNGYYNITLSSIDQPTVVTSLYQASPNPFYSQTAVSFSLAKSGPVCLSVYNIQGQAIRTLENKNLTADNYIYEWDGCSGSGIRQMPGTYLIVLETAGKRYTQKVILLAGNNIQSVGAFHELKSFTASTYRIQVTASDADTLLLRNIEIPESNQLDFSLFRHVSVPFATVNDYLGVWNGTDYDQIFIKGINLGVSVPGTLPGELAATRAQYTHWLNMIGEAGFNAIRIYTLHYPRFYEELAIYNNAHPDHPIYLFQGIWLQEDTLNGNLYHYTDGFDTGIKEVVDCIHGNKTIGERYGRAYGKFDADVSRWVIGYIIGREIYPYEVEMTDFLNIEKNKYEGTALRLPSGSATEVWIAQRLDNLIVYENNNYKSQHPVSISSWPTLDPIEHPSEPDNMTDEDIMSIDMQQIDMFNAPAGYFASYHAYPYYPDFINRDPDYVHVTDDEGPNPYLGYLKQLKNHYASRPLIIAEYGVPSSWAVAHKANSGMDHGGHTETEQGEMDIRLLKTIKEAGCGGGMMFSWIDEWFKRTWVFDPIKSEPARMPLWHSVASAEENFGLLAFDPPTPSYKQYSMSGTYNKVSASYAAADAQYLRLKLHLNTVLSNTDTLWVGLDTYNESLGESILPNKATTSKRAEFALSLTKDSAKLFVTQAYDLYAIWFIRDNSYPEELYHSVATNGANWNLLRLKYNFEDTAFQKTGNLRVRKTGYAETTLDAVWFSGSDIYIRIPWHYLNFTDPSALLVMNDNRSTNARETKVTDGIALTICYKSEKATTGRFLWNAWNQAPATSEREKAGLSIITAGNQSISEQPPVTTKKSKKKK